jgi:hypothetical protein
MSVVKNEEGEKCYMSEFPALGDHIHLFLVAHRFATSQCRVAVCVYVCIVVVRTVSLQACCVGVCVLHAMCRLCPSKKWTCEPQGCKT